MNNRYPQKQGITLKKKYGQHFLKQESYVDDYRMQLVAYIMAHNNTYGTNIRRGVIFMAVKPPEIAPGVYGESKYQQFDLLPTDFNYWEDQWLNKVETYYKLNP